MGKLKMTHLCVAITGAQGSIGLKLAPRSATVWDGFLEEIIGSYEHCQATLTEWGDWAAHLKGVDTVVHLAAVNPYPECTWQEANQSMDMTANVIAAAQKAGVRRLVFASSNHCVGNHWRDGAVLDPPAADMIGPHTPPHPDTFQLDAEASCDFRAYASAKLTREYV